MYYPVVNVYLSPSVPDLRRIGPEQDRSLLKLSLKEAWLISSNGGSSSVLEVPDSFADTCSASLTLNRCHTFPGLSPGEVCGGSRACICAASGPDVIQIIHNEKGFEQKYGNVPTAACLIAKISHGVNEMPTFETGVFIPFRNHTDFPISTRKQKAPILS